MFKVLPLCSRNYDRDERYKDRTSSPLLGEAGEFDVSKWDFSCEFCVSFGFLTLTTECPSDVCCREAGREVSGAESWFFCLVHPLPSDVVRPLIYLQK